ncbi:hypothetical protein Riv7116_0908 [Rivularia sp. PCC 7116]|nr:hypothetical protein Riv7116_0908 [Rivularia sp. PCC 7116]
MSPIYRTFAIRLELAVPGGSKREKITMNHSDENQMVQDMKREEVMINILFSP